MKCYALKPADSPRIPKFDFSRFTDIKQSLKMHAMGRGAIRIGDRIAAGKKVDPLQRAKLERKEEVLAEVNRFEDALGVDTILRLIIVPLNRAIYWYQRPPF